MSFKVNRAERRTFYLERYAAFWLVPRVWQAGAPASPEEAVRLINRALQTEPRERWLADQADSGLMRAPWHSVVLHPRSDPNADDTRWDVVRVYQPDEPIESRDLVAPNVLAVAATIIPRNKPGQPVRVITRDPKIELDAWRVAHRVLDHGEQPVDSGQ